MLCRWAEQFGWGHRTTLKDKLEQIKSISKVGWWLSGWGVGDFRSHFGSHQTSAWIQNPSSSGVWHFLILFTISIEI